MESWHLLVGIENSRGSPSARRLDTTGSSRQLGCGAHRCVCVLTRVPPAPAPTQAGPARGWEEEEAGER